MNRLKTLITLVSFAGISAMQAASAQVERIDASSKRGYKNDERMIARIADSTSTILIAKVTSDDPMPGSLNTNSDFEFTVLNGASPVAGKAYVLKTAASEIPLDNAGFKLLKFNWIETLQVESSKEIVSKYSHKPGIKSVVFIQLKDDSVSEALLKLREAGKIEASLNE